MISAESKSLSSCKFAIARLNISSFASCPFLPSQHLRTGEPCSCKYGSSRTIPVGEWTCWFKSLLAHPFQSPLVSLAFGFLPLRLFEFDSVPCPVLEPPIVLDFVTDGVLQLALCKSFFFTLTSHSLPKASDLLTTHLTSRVPW